MSLFVIDASIALALVFKDEVSPYTDRISTLLEESSAIVPVIWPLEVTNALLVAVRRGRLDGGEPQRLIEVLVRLPIDVDQSVPLASLGRETLELAVRYGLSVYDASYPELALRRGLPLATQDKRLAEAANAAGVETLQP